MGPEFVENLGLIQKSASKRLNKVSKDLAKTFNVLRNNVNKLSFEQLSEAVQKAETVIVDESLKFAKMMDTIIENVGQTPELINIRLEQSLADMPQVIAQSLGGALSAMSLDSITQVQTKLFSDQAKKTTKNIDDSFRLLAKGIADESKAFSEGRGVRLEAAKKVSEKDLTGALEKGGKAPPEEAKKLAAAIKVGLGKAEKGEVVDEELMRSVEERSDAAEEDAKKAQEVVDRAKKFAASPIADLLKMYEANATQVQAEQKNVAKQIAETEAVIEKGKGEEEVKEAKTKLTGLKEKQEKLEKAVTDAGTALAMYRGDFIEDVQKQLEVTDGEAVAYVKKRVNELGGWSRVEVEQLQKIMSEEGAKGLDKSIAATLQPLSEKGKFAKEAASTIRTQVSGLKAAKFEIPTMKINQFIEKSLGEINNLAAKYADIVIKTVERKSGELLLSEKKLQGMESVLSQAGELGVSFEYLKRFSDAIVEKAETGMKDVNARMDRMNKVLTELSSSFEGIGADKLTAEGLKEMVAKQAESVGLQPKDVEEINRTIEASFKAGGGKVIDPKQIAKNLRTSMSVKAQEAFNVIATETAEDTTKAMEQLINAQRSSLAVFASSQEEFASTYMDAVMAGTMAFDPKLAEAAVKAAKTERDEIIKITEEKIKDVNDRAKKGYEEQMKLLEKAQEAAAKLPEGSKEREQADQNAAKIAEVMKNTENARLAAVQKARQTELAAETKYRTTALKFSQSELDVRQKFLDISKEVANTQLGVLEQIGAPFGLVMQKQAEIVGYAKDALDIERGKLEVIQDQLAVMAEGPEKNQKMLAIEEQRKKVVQAEAEVMNKAVQAQRSSIEKLLGAAVGEIGKIGGFRRASKAQIFGAGYVEGPGGIVVRGGATSKAQQAARVQMGMFKTTKSATEMTKDNTEATGKNTDTTTVNTDATSQNTVAIIGLSNSLAGNQQAMPPILKAGKTPALGAQSTVSLVATVETEMKKDMDDLSNDLKQFVSSLGSDVGSDAATQKIQKWIIEKQKPLLEKQKKLLKLSLKDTIDRTQAEEKTTDLAKSRVRFSKDEIGDNEVMKTLQEKLSKKQKEIISLSSKDSISRIQAEKKIMELAEARVYLEEEILRVVGSGAAVKITPEKKTEGTLKPIKEILKNLAGGVKKTAINALSAWNELVEKTTTLKAFEKTPGGEVLQRLTSGIKKTATSALGVWNELTKKVDTMKVPEKTPEKTKTDKEVAEQRTKEAIEKNKGEREERLTKDRERGKTKKEKTEQDRRKPEVTPKRVLEKTPQSEALQRVVGGVKKTAENMLGSWKDLTKEAGKMKAPLRKYDSDQRLVQGREKGRIRKEESDKRLASKRKKDPVTQLEEQFAKEDAQAHEKMVKEQETRDRGISDRRKKNIDDQTAFEKNIQDIKEDLASKFATGAKKEADAAKITQDQYAATLAKANDEYNAKMMKIAKEESASEAARNLAKLQKSGEIEVHLAKLHWEQRETPAYSPEKPMSEEAKQVRIESMQRMVRGSRTVREGPVTGEEPREQQGRTILKLAERLEESPMTAVAEQVTPPKEDKSVAEFLAQRGIPRQVSEKALASTSAPTATSDETGDIADNTAKTAEQLADVATTLQAITLALGTVGFNQKAVSDLTNAFVAAAKSMPKPVGASELS
jgi:hypothetical protein